MAAGCPSLLMAQGREDGDRAGWGAGFSSSSCGFLCLPVSEAVAFFFLPNFFLRSTQVRDFTALLPNGRRRVSLHPTELCFLEKPGAASDVYKLRNAVAVFVFVFWAKAGSLPVLSKYRAALMRGCGSQGHARCLREARWIHLGTPAAAFLPLAKAEPLAFGLPVLPCF